MPSADFRAVAVESRYDVPSRTVDPDRSRSWWRRMLPLWLAHRWVVGGTVVFSVLAVAAQVIAPYVLGRGVDAVLEAGASVVPYAVALGALAVARFGFGRVQRYLLQLTGFSIEYDLRVLLYEHFNRLPVAYYDTHGSGQLISRANSDVRAIERFLSFGPGIVATSTFTFVIALALMFRIHPGLTVAALAPLVVLYPVGQMMRRRVFPVSWIVQARQADVATVVEENTAGIRIVKAFAAEPFQVNELARQARRLEWASVQEADIRARFGSALENLPRVSQLIVLGFGGWLAIGGAITVGDILAFVAWVLLLQSPFRTLGFLVMMTQRAAASAERIYEIFDAPPEIEDAPGAPDLTGVRGAVELRDVHFAYRDEPVLRGVSLTIEPGETVAVVGRTGSGKSTLVRLIPRFYDVDGGAVLIDGHDVREVTVGSLRHHVGFVMDEPFLFSDTLRDNVAYGRLDATDDEVVTAATAAGASEFIDRLPAGYATVVGERGYDLSGGQRQRLALARALVDNPPILILDDATSSVDVHTEQAIHATLGELLGQRTTLVVAHRLSTIALADRVVVLEDGQVAAQGTHEQLLAEVPLYREILASVESED